jgi:hypothetical protein
MTSPTSGTMTLSMLDWIAAISSPTLPVVSTERRRRPGECWWRSPGRRPGAHPRRAARSGSRRPAARSPRRSDRCLRRSRPDPARRRHRCRPRWASSPRPPRRRRAGRRRRCELVAVRVERTIGIAQALVRIQDRVAVRVPAIRSAIPAAGGSRPDQREEHGDSDTPHAPISGRLVRAENQCSRVCGVGFWRLWSTRCDVVRVWLPVPGD